MLEASGPFSPFFFSPPPILCVLRMCACMFFHMCGVHVNMCICTLIVEA